MAIKGLDVIYKFAKLQEEKWSLSYFLEEDKWWTELNETDVKILRVLNYVGDGEFSGTGMGLHFWDLLQKQPKEVMYDFYEAFEYAHFIIQDEFRHGIVIKTLNSLLDGDETYLVNVDDQAPRTFEYKKICDNCFEMQMIFLISEIYNFEIYNHLKKMATHSKLKELMDAVAKDEARHLAGWTAFITKQIDHSEEYAKAYLDAFISVNAKHQAEVCDKYAYGLQDLQKFIDYANNLKKINKQKLTLVKQWFPNIELDEYDLLKNNVMNIKSLFDELKK